MNEMIGLTSVTSPVGTIIAFAGNVEKYKDGNITTSFVTSPIESYGWMLCDGSSLEVYKYPELYAVLGNLYGSNGSGETMTFNLPDLRGQFLRGIGTDYPSTENRTAAPNGERNGVGSTQKDALQTHQHQYGKPVGGMSGDRGNAFTAIDSNAYTGNPASLSDPSSVQVSNYETRPTNVFVNYLIKYTYRLPRIY